MDRPQHDGVFLIAFEDEATAIEIARLQSEFRGGLSVAVYKNQDGTFSLSRVHGGVIWVWVTTIGTSLVMR